MRPSLSLACLLCAAVVLSILAPAFSLSALRALREDSRALGMEGARASASDRQRDSRELARAQGDACGYGGTCQPKGGWCPDKGLQQPGSPFDCGAEFKCCGKAPPSTDMKEPITQYYYHKPGGKIPSWPCFDLAKDTAAALLANPNVPAYQDPFMLGVAKMGGATVVAISKGAEVNRAKEKLGVTTVVTADHVWKKPANDNYLFVRYTKEANQKYHEINGQSDDKWTCAAAQLLLYARGAGKEDTISCMSEVWVKPEGKAETHPINTMIQSCERCEKTLDKLWA